MSEDLRKWVQDSGLALLFPGQPHIPDAEPPFIFVAYTAEALKEYRLAGAHWIVRAHYDVVQRMIEEGILRRHEREYVEWLAWVKRNL